MSGLTPKLPLVLDEQDGAYLLIKDYRKLVAQNLKNLVLTSPGERMMDVNFGVGIRNFLFENAGAQLNSEISEKVLEQVSVYMPFVNIQDIEFNYSDTYDNSLNMKIYYYVVPLNLTDNLSISLPFN
jgi:uncharacterized protein